MRILYDVFKKEAVKFLNSRMSNQLFLLCPGSNPDKQSPGFDRKSVFLKRYATKTPFFFQYSAIIYLSSGRQTIGQFLCVITLRKPETLSESLLVLGKNLKTSIAIQTCLKEIKYSVNPLRNL